MALILYKKGRTNHPNLAQFFGIKTRDLSITPSKKSLPFHNDEFHILGKKTEKSANPSAVGKKA
jgi:hypothetical protein